MSSKACPRIATADVELNAALVGLPAILSPSQGTEGPVRIDAGRDTVLAYRNPSDADAYVVGHYLMVWRIVEGALEWVNPTPATLGAGLGIELYLSWMESAGRSLTDAASHWSNLASHRGRPHYWPERQWVQPRSVLSARVSNRSSEDLAVSLHPLVLRQTSGQLGNQLRANVDAAALQAEARRIMQPLTPWPGENVQRGGVPVILFSPDGEVALESGTFAAPGPTLSTRISTHDAYWLHIDRLFGSIREVGDDQIDELLTKPVFAKVRDSRNNLHLTEGWVPLGCLVGSAEDPALLPAPWVTPTAGAIVAELRSHHSADVVASFGVGGLYRTEA